jgi:predicted AAA+ superfamily ATPase
VETTFLVLLLPAWSGNLGQRVIRSPKVYLNDTGLLTHLLGLTAERFLLDAGPIGGALENFVLMELKEQSAWSLRARNSITGVRHRDMKWTSCWKIPQGARSVSR